MTRREDRMEDYPPRSIDVTLPDGRQLTIGLKRVGEHGYLNPRQLADRIGVSLGTYSNSCRDKSRPDVRQRWTEKLLAAAVLDLIIPTAVES